MSLIIWMKLRMKNTMSGIFELFTTDIWIVQICLHFADKMFSMLLLVSYPFKWYSMSLLNPFLKFPEKVPDVCGQWTNFSEGNSTDMWDR